MTSVFFDYVTTILASSSLSFLASSWSTISKASLLALLIEKVDLYATKKTRSYMKAIYSVIMQLLCVYPIAFPDS